MWGWIVLLWKHFQEYSTEDFACQFSVIVSYKSYSL
jgi:hypothetical protein